MARTWSKSPSELLGLRAGSVEAFVLDRDLAERLAGEAEREAQEGVNIAALPTHDESSLPDPFARAPGELGGLS